MSPLAGELHRILKSGETLRADSFPNILHALGFGVDRVSVEQVEGALTEVINAGLADRE